MPSKSLPPCAQWCDFDGKACSRRWLTLTCCL
jgi:hypothetical protein